eukprot:1138028-Pelagomonas_calceolata.AAC.4
MNRTFLLCKEIGVQGKASNLPMFPCIWTNAKMALPVQTSLQILKPLCLPVSQRVQGAIAEHLKVPITDVTIHQKRQMMREYEKKKKKGA